MKKEESTENNPRHLKAAARELLKAAKIAEAQRMRNGATWIRKDLKSWVLQKNEVEGEASDSSL